MMEEPVGPSSHREPRIGVSAVPSPTFPLPEFPMRIGGMRPLPRSREAAFAAIWVATRSLFVPYRWAERLVFCKGGML